MAVMLLNRVCFFAVHMSVMLSNRVCFFAVHMSVMLLNRVCFSQYICRLCYWIEYVFRSASAFAVRKQSGNWMPWYAFLNIQVSTQVVPYTTVWSWVILIIVLFSGILWPSQKSEEKIQGRGLRILLANYNSGVTWASWHHHSPNTAVSFNCTNCIWIFTCPHSRVHKNDSSPLFMCHIGCMTPVCQINNVAEPQHLGSKQFLISVQNCEMIHSF